MLNFVQHRKWYYLFSGLLILISFIAMGISIATYPERSPLRLSIDFLGGSLMEFRLKPIESSATTGSVTEAMITSVFNRFSSSDVRVQRLGDTTDTSGNRWQVRTGYLNENDTESVKTALNDAVKSSGFELDTNSLRTSTVSPTVGKEAAQAAIVAVIAGSIIVIGFIVFAFRKITNAVRYGVCSIIAMIHDVIILLGAMSILGLIFSWEADSLFLTAVLTVVAYSVQDSIVVFDRIRENVYRYRGQPFELIVNRSVIETVQRSITTQVLVAFILVSLILLGGATMRPFVTVLLVGLISGTYSSLFIGIPLLVSWERAELPFVGQRDLVSS